MWYDGRPMLRHAKAAANKNASCSMTTVRSEPHRDDQSAASIITRNG